MKITKQLHKQLWAYSLRILLMVMTLIVFPKDSLRAQCPDPVNFLYLLDNSGSISAADWNGMRNMINSSVTAVKAEFPNALFAIVHMAYSGGTSGVQSNFTNTPPLVAGKLDSGNSPNISFNGLASEISDNDGYLEGNTSAPMVVVYFTDGSASEHTNGAYAGRNAFMTAALARYPQVEIIVVQVGSSAQAAAAATASVGGMYYGTPLANGGDPEGSRTTPRNMIYRSSFTGNVDAELLATYSCTPCTGSENQSATFDFDPRSCAAKSLAFWIPAGVLAQYNMTVNGKTGCDYNGFTGANAICNYAANLSGATSFVSARAGTFVAFLQGTGAINSPNFADTYDLTRPLMGADGVISAYTLEDFFDRTLGHYSTVSNLFYTYDGIPAGSGVSILVHPNPCYTCDPITGFRSNPYLSVATTDNCNNWTSASMPNGTVAVQIDGQFHDAATIPTAPAFQWTSTNCADCGKLAGFWGDAGMWCISE